MLSLVKTNGKSRHGERPVSRIANGYSCHGEHPFHRGRFPVRGSQSGFYSSARKESSLEPFSHGVSFEGDRVGIVDEPVEDGIGQGGFSDALVPEVDRILAGDQGGSGLPAVLEDLEEVVALVLGEGQKTEIVQNQKIDLGPGGQETGGLPDLPGQGDLGEEPGSAQEKAGKAEKAGLMSEGPGEKSLAHPCGADDQEVLVGPDPLPACQFLDEGAVQAPGSPVVDVLETGGLPDPAFGETPGELLVLPLEELPVGQKTQSLLEGQVTGLRGLHLFPEPLGHDGKAQAVKLVDRGMVQHGGSPFVSRVA